MIEQSLFVKKELPSVEFKTRCVNSSTALYRFFRKNPEYATNINHEFLMESLNKRHPVSAGVFIYQMDHVGLDWNISIKDYRKKSFEDTITVLDSDKIGELEFFNIMPFDFYRYCEYYRKQLEDVKFYTRFGWSCDIADLDNAIYGYCRIKNKVYVMGFAYYHALVIDEIRYHKKKACYDKGVDAIYEPIDCLCCSHLNACITRSIVTPPCFDEHRDKIDLMASVEVIAQRALTLESYVDNIKDGVEDE